MVSRVQITRTLKGGWVWAVYRRHALPGNPAIKDGTSRTWIMARIRAGWEQILLRVIK